MGRLLPSLLRSTVLASAISASAILIFLVSPEARTDDEVVDLARGASLYSENCGRCHNARGPSEFSDVYWPVIVTHMRVIAGLPGEQARSIEAFLRASNNPAPRRVARLKSAGEASDLSGEELIKTYGCQGCHRVGGVGGSIGPDLGGIFGRQSDEWIRVQIQSPREHNIKTVMPQFGLSDSQISAIIKALRTAAATE